MKQKSYERLGGAYVCMRCYGVYSTHCDMTRHLFHSNDPCATPPEPVRPLAFASVPFDGPRAAVDAALSGEKSPAHRDSLGRLRVRGTLTGYRRWSIGRVNGAHRLFPVFRADDTPWARGVLTAVCDRDGDEVQHPAPHLDCQCGIYAFWDPDRVSHVEMAQDRSLISGRIKGFGVTVPGATGWRAQYAIVDAIDTPRCVEPGCTASSTRGVVRPTWNEQLTPGGRTYPPANSARHDAYRETGDFKARHLVSPYIGWFCDAHGATEFRELRWPARCNFPITDHRVCTRPARTALEGCAYSWCYEHAPIVLDTATVMRELRAYYDLPAEEVV